MHQLKKLKGLKYLDSRYLFVSFVLFVSCPTRVILGLMIFTFSILLLPTGVYAQDITSGLAPLQSWQSSLKTFFQEFVSVPFAHAQSADIVTGLIGHWKFDEGSGTSAADSSGNNNTGTLTNGPTWTTGKIGGAVSFDGVDDRVSLTSKNIGVVNSVSVWISIQSTGEASIVAGDGGYYALATDGISIGNNLCYSASFYACVPHGGLSSGIWYHLAVIRNGTSVTFYKNGTLLGTPQTLNTSYDLSLATIGSYTPPGNSGLIYPLKGLLDDVRIYNRILSSTDVQALYALGSGGGTPSPPSDTTPPAVSITAPIAGSTVSGSSATVSAAASDNVGVSGVQFKLDGANLQAEDTSSPYTISWNTTTVSNGSHTLTATVRDAAGNQATSAAVMVSVSNAAPPPSTGTALGNLAASMAPETWAILNTNGFGAELLDSGFGQNIMQFASKATWEPFNKRFLFLGQGHYATAKFITYSDATNTWQSEPKPYWDCSPDCLIGHAFEHNALDPATGDFYYRVYASRNIYKYTRTTASWSALPELPTSVLSNIQVSGAIEYFPEMGGLVFVDSWGIAFFNVTTNQWNKLSNPLPMGAYSNFASYNPVHHVMIFGGGNGSSNLYKLDATGRITTMRNAPISMGVTSTVQTADPVSGKYIVLGTTSGDFYVYDVQTDTWQSQPGTPSIFNDIRDGGVIAAPVSTYGVIMYITWNFDQSKVYLYKHSTGTVPPPSVDTQAPSAPTNLTATAISSSQINLSWNASMDNVGVTGYRVERCQGSGCTNFAQIATPTTTSYNDTGLTPSTVYTYRILAVDAAGNLSQYSSIVNATTQATTPSPGGSDFATRCSQPGVVRCYGFDDLIDLTTGHPRTLTNPTDSTISRMYNPASGTTQCTGGKCWELDTVTKASGASALRFEIPSNTGADTSGTFRLNFADDFSQQFGAGEEFYVQYRERFSPEMLRVFQGANGWKQSIIGLGDRLNGPIAYSCTAEEMVFQQGAALTTVGDDGFVGFYHGCGFWETMQFWDGTQVRWQHQGPPYCYYPNDPNRGCFYYMPNEWMTFKMHIKIAGWGTVPGNRVRVWAARENQPSVFILDSINSHPNGFPIHQTDATSKYGKIWLLPYNTNKSSAETHPTAYIWYDDLIISRNDIADPSTDSGQPLLGDLNLDGTVNNFDWNIMAGVWFTNDPVADINKDTIVNTADFYFIYTNWNVTR